MIDNNMADTEQEKFRSADLNDPVANKTRILQESYCSSNSVTTAKFSKLSFFPVTLFEFFTIVANVYFLIISGFQLFTTLNPENSPYTTIGPLMMVLFISMLKQGIEDLKRHKADKETNNKKVERLTPGGRIETILWSDVQVGDILKIYDREQFAADCIILASSEDEGRCFTETANLDGETNLKRRSTLNETSELTGVRIPGDPPLDPDVHAKAVSELKGRLHFETPNNRLYNFTGKLELENSGNTVTIPIFPDRVILRGCMLRSCNYVFGAVVFTGIETKLMQNMRPAPSKTSNLYRIANQCIWLVFVAQLCMMIYSSYMFGEWNDDHPDVWYIQSSGGISDIDKFLSIFTFLMLYANLVPISLYVSMDIIKWRQGAMIENDENMTLNEFNARARTSDINEDLGQIEYVFSDKTGTLTCNIMEFRKCYINGISYGYGTTEIGRAAALRMGKEDLSAVVNSKSDPKLAQMNYNPEINFDDPRLLKNLSRGSEHAPYIDAFLTLLSVCHTVIPENTGGKVEYRAASPDEEALVKAAKCLGYDLKTSAPEIEVSITKGKRMSSYTSKFIVLAINEFTSTRKRMSSLVKLPNGQYILYAKGADNVMFERSKEPKDIVEMNTALNTFASEGLRTLVCAQRIIPPDEYNEWITEYEEAMSSMENRDQKLVDVAEKIERNMFIVGCTAIEDKLQEGVPKTIVDLAEAGIKIWVLTGDKEETAINIGFACGLIDDSMKLVKVTKAGSRDDVASKIIDAKALQEVKDAIAAGYKKINMGLIVDGAALHHIFDDSIEDDKDIKSLFLEVCRICKAVVACRVSPAQKARIVSLVRDGVKPEPITLAIGDGANDVNMIQTAHVGIGISGQEGVQAVNSSDYAIAQFRFLKNLLLVHGSNNYRNLCMCILYSFYKNIALITTLFLFNDANGQSGSTLYESYIKLMWNVFLSWPIVVIGIYDREVSEIAYMDNPKLYFPGQKNAHLNPWKFSQYAINGIVHGCIVYIVPMSSLGLASWSPDGSSDGLLIIGTTLYTAIFIVMNWKVAFMTKSWHMVASVTFWVCFLSYFAFVMLYSSVQRDSDTSFYNIGFVLLNRPMFWLLNVLIVLTCILFDVAVTYLSRMYFPDLAVILRERERLGVMAPVDGDDITRAEGEDNGKSAGFDN